jgi:hypothetical protein
MDESKATPKAVVLSAVLHIGIVGFLFLAILPCSSYESAFEALHLPAWMNPITCSKPLELKGQIIEATLIGPTGSPPPKAVKAKPVPDTVPPSADGAAAHAAANRTTGDQDAAAAPRRMSTWWIRKR